MRTLTAGLAGLTVLGCAGRVAPSFAPYLKTPTGLSTKPPAGGPRFRSIGLPELAARNLPEGYRELRISRGIGMVATVANPLLRIVEGPKGIAGEVIQVRAIYVGDARSSNSIVGAPR
jgi:hypothetical protein